MKPMTKAQIERYLKKAPPYSQFHLTVLRTGGTKFKPFTYEHRVTYISRENVRDYGLPIVKIEHTVVRPVVHRPAELPAGFGCD